mgnify:CR=1 FL=1
MEVHTPHTRPTKTQAVFHDRFDSAHHRAGAICVFNLSILYIGLDPEVPFYAGKRVYYYSF